MGLIDVSGILIGIIAALGAWAAKRSAAKATRNNVVVSARMDAEQGAYERARSFDMDTIARQELEIARLRADNKALQEELKEVRKRLNRIELVIPEWERLLRERSDEPDDPK